ncbi:MAG: molybdopterin converting factor subunit 1 [Kangiellaceae bacterium]|nr:molybdopterin converting factor subunit 1 [Kangiellaceae bacterium]
MVKVLFFASLRDKAGCNELTLEIDNDISVDSLINQMVVANANLNDVFSGTFLTAVNQETVELEHLVKPGDEIAFFPPVTGG